MDDEAYLAWYKRSKVVERVHNTDGSVTEVREAMCILDMPDVTAIKRVANISSAVEQT